MRQINAVVGFLDQRTCQLCLRGLLILLTLFFLVDGPSTKFRNTDALYHCAFDFNYRRRLHDLFLISSVQKEAGLHNIKFLPKATSAFEIYPGFDGKLAVALLLQLFWGALVFSCVNYRLGLNCWYPNSCLTRPHRALKCDRDDQNFLVQRWRRYLVEVSGMVAAFFDLLPCSFFF